ncbi:MAG: hypothetical protein AAF566_07765 [Pseudomonadota bacterium]
MTPRVAEFGATVERITSADQGNAAFKTLGPRVADARLRDFNREGVRFVTPGVGDDPITESEETAITSCEYVRPDLPTNKNRYSERFRSGCALIPLRVSDEAVVASVFDGFEAQSRVGPENVVQTQNTTLLREFLGFELRRELNEYAIALKALSMSDLPSEIGTASSGAFDAVLGLRDAVGIAADETDTPPPPSNDRVAAQKLVPRLANELAEAARFKRLRDTVQFADPFVQRAALQLTILTYEMEAAKLEGAYRRFENERAPDDWGSLRNLKATEASWTALAKADDAARFRVYADIANTHAAILQSLRNPASLAQLSDANTRIFDLIEAARPLIEE